ncbi:MAG: hypothetical protein Q9167_002102 [Letrouitia subvulpina]
MEAWAGDVAIGSDSRALKEPDLTRREDVHFHELQESSCSFCHVALRFLALVQVSRIPLYLIAGPSLVVWTSSAQTEQWFTSRVLHSGDGGLENSWWKHPYGQSDRGILLKVEEQQAGSSESPSQITEILIYAARPNPAGDQQHRLLSRASPPHPHTFDTVQDNKHNEEDIRLYAFPLSSRVLVQATEASKIDLLSSNSTQSHLHVPQSGSQISIAAEQAPHKRQKIQTLFEDATQNRRVFKKRGGEGISKVMAESSGLLSPSLPSSSFSNPLDFGSRSLEYQKASTTRNTESKRIALTRSSTTGSIRALEPTRPPSRRSTLSNVKRISLNHVESTLSVGTGSPAPEEVNGVEEQNKSTLSRIVMAGMRMYGLKRQERKSVFKETPNESQMCEDQETADEYKLVYHQTFKAATFALRADISLNPVSQDIMRDVVDRLLAILCNNPIKECASKQTVGFGSQEIVNSALFDQPSSQVNRNDSVQT